MTFLKIGLLCYGPVQNSLPKALNMCKSMILSVVLCGGVTCSSPWSKT